MHSSWLASECRASGAYASATLLLLLLPQTLLFAFAWQQCAPAEVGGYVLEEPGVSCGDEGYRGWALPLRLVPLYLLLPLVAIGAQVFGVEAASTATAGAW